MPSYVYQGKWLAIVHWICESGVTRVPIFENTTGAQGLVVLASTAGYDKTNYSLGPEYDGTAEEGISLYTFEVTAAAPTFTCGDAKGLNPVVCEVIVTPLDVDLVSLHYARKAYLRCEAARMRKVAQDYRDRQNWVDSEMKEMKQLRQEVALIRQMMNPNYQDLHEEKDEILQPPRRKRAVEEPSDDDGSVVSIRTRTRSTPKT
jgi:hypothetical protein